ncbi:MAG: hypothetical protein QOF68_2698, partial [Gaiellales bacterium]|nr:hypothetical protein [Gaiellales bacterium]
SAKTGGEHTASPKPTSDTNPLATITPATPIAATKRAFAVASRSGPGILDVGLFAAGTSLLATLLALTAGHLATRPKRR